MTAKKTGKAAAETVDPIDEGTHFEEALEELEALVDQMESGELSLDASLAAFERGVRLARHCQGALKNAEQRVQLLNAEGGLEPFDDLADDSEP